MTSSDSGHNKKRKLADVADSNGIEDSKAAVSINPLLQPWPVSNGTRHPARPQSTAYTNTARLFPEWGLPEPVAVPQAAGALQELSWLQSSDTQQASDSQPAVSQHQRSNHDHQHSHHSNAEPEMVSPAQHAIPPDDTLSSPHQQSHLPDQQVATGQPQAHVQMSGLANSFDNEAAQQHLHCQHQAPHQHPWSSQSQPASFAKPALITEPGDPSQQPPLRFQAQPEVHASPAADNALQATALTHQPSSRSQPPDQQSLHQQPSYQQPLQQQSPHLQLQQEQPSNLEATGQQASHQQASSQEASLQQPGQQPPPAVAASLSAELRQQPEAGPSNAAGLSTANLGAYSQRELFLQNMEDSGDMSFEYVLNDGQRHNNIWLIALKNIFSKQLPNMPREYIARLVLDRRHRSVAIVRRKRNVVGGITYRPFHQQGFGEIAFCAVTANEQVKGFGTRLMNFTKEYAKTQDHLTHFLTYADNNAVGYFAKQGFTKEITLDKEYWVGFIKDYDGGTLMECVVVQRLPHTRLPAMLQAQKQALESCIRHYSKSHVVREGLKDFQQGARHVDIACIPGVKDAGWDPGDSSGTGVRLLMNNSILDATPNNLQHFMLMVVHQMQAHEDFWCFLQPVTAEEVPDYRDVIKDPVDLSLMESRLKRKNYYLTLDIFAADMRRIFNNCRLYNVSDSIWYKSANKAESFFDHFMHTHLLFGQT